VETFVANIESRQNKKVRLFMVRKKKYGVKRNALKVKPLKIKNAVKSTAGVGKRGIR
jgi:hypothetical protein